MYRIAVAAMIAALGIVTAACRARPPAPEAVPTPPQEVTTVEERFTLTSSAFADGERIPARYTADGDNLSPPLAWSGAPEGTVSFVLIVDDPDAPRGTFTHWVLYAIPGTRADLPTDVPTKDTVRDLGGAKQGLNNFGMVGYAGPAPPRGPVHHYRFTLYALSAQLELPPRAERGEVEKAMATHLLGQARLVGTYSR